MRRLPFIVLAALSAAMAGVPAPAFAGAERPPGDAACAGFFSGAQGLCNAYCVAQDCPAHPDRHACAILRRNFERETGGAVLLCAGAAGATAAATRTPTATVLPPTPTDTPDTTASATAGASEAPTGTATRRATATAIAIGVPTGTATADVCAGLRRGAQGLCRAFCQAQDCPSDPHPSCEILRRNFARQTGRARFPCEGGAAPPTPTAVGTETPETEACMGDCEGDGVVDVADLTRALLVMLGERDPSACAGWRRNGHAMTIGDMVRAVRHALDGCN